MNADSGLVLEGLFSMHSRSLAAAIAISLATVILPLPGHGAIAAGATCRGLTVTIAGTNGADDLVGTPGPDVIDGGNGNDTIVGLGGNDTICGGNGNDVLSGGDGDDTVDGGNGNDTITGGGGGDELYGMNGSDTIHGGQGDDQIEGFNGNDTLDGGGGTDLVDGGNGNDSCDDAETAPSCETITYDGEPGEPPSEPIVCNGLTATLVGTDGDDTLTGTNGPDVIVALGGNDTINGGNGHDVICAGPGDDIVNGGNGDDIIDGGDGADEIIGHNGHDSLNGGGGPDTIGGGNGNDTILGGDGDDVIQGWNGRDTIHGGDGDDNISGHNGNDELDGGNGVDEALGGNGNDICDDFETTTSCETETSDGEPGGIEIIDEITIPDNPAPLVFDVNTAGFDGVDLEVTTSGGLYPWDVVVEDAVTTTTMAPVVVSELINIEMNPDASGFASAVLTLVYDEALIIETDETDLRIWTFDEFAQLWVPAGDTQSVDVDANTVTATLEHFSIYAVLDMDAQDPESWDLVLGEPVVQCVASEPSGNFDLALMLDNDALGASGIVPGLLDSLQDTIDLVSADRRISVSRFDYVDAETTFADRLALPSSKALAKTHVANLRGENEDEPNDIIFALDALRYSVWETDAVRPFPRRVAIIVAVSDPTIRGYTQSSLRLRILRLLVAGVQVYVVGDGPASENPLLQHIATEVHQGLYFDIADTTGLVDAVSQAGSNVDDGTDTDLDTITDCVETNGAFTPAIFTGAAPTGDDTIVTAHESAYFVLNPANADTDNDGVDDNIELVEADLRDDPLIAQTYAYLIEAGVTRYFRLVSDPTDPTDPSGDVGGGDDFPFGSGLLDVEGLDLSQSTLFQPIRYGGFRSVESRLLAHRSATGVTVSLHTYVGAPVVYDEGENCVVRCVEVETLALSRHGDGWFGCSTFGDDFACEVKEVVTEARADQGIFGGDDYLSKDFLREQTALRCALNTGDLDGCVELAYLVEYENIEPVEGVEVIERLSRDGGRWLQPHFVHQISGTQSLGIIRGGDLEDFFTFRRSVVVVFDNFDLLDATLGAADGVLTLSELDNPTGISTEIDEAISFLHDTFFGRLVNQITTGDLDDLRKSLFRHSIVRSEAFELDPDLALRVLEHFPIVESGASELWIGTFDAQLGQVPSVQRLVGTAFEVVDAGDRSLHAELIARVPETTSGIRNALFNAVYIEYANAVQNWVDPQREKGKNWAYAATWASIGAGKSVRGEFPAVFQGIQQTFADGNQWIFNDLAVRYGALIEVIEINPNPSEGTWQMFFAENFGDGDQLLRDGFLALIAAKYEPDAARAQQLMFQSTMLFLTHEQAGAQPYIKDLDLIYVPDTVEALFANTELGQDRILHTARDIDGDLSIDLDSPTADPRFGTNLIWGSNVLELDPTGADASIIFDAPGFDVQVGGPSAQGSVDVDEISGLGPDVATSWTTWRNEGAHDVYTDPNTGTQTEDPNVCGPSTYCGTAATRWWDYPERMWYLLNVFRIINNDFEVERTRDEVSFSNPQFGVYGEAMLSQLRVDVSS